MNGLCVPQRQTESRLWDERPNVDEARGGDGSAALGK